MLGIDEILTASWRVYPSWLLLLGGVWLGRRGLALHRSVPPELRDPHRALQIARSFRLGIAGLCLIGWAVGWLWSIGWIVVVSFIILGEEMLETSTMIAALRAGARSVP